MKPTRLLLLILCLCPIAVYAQNAEVGGAVHDPSGAVIPKASVEFRNQDTGIRRQTTSNGNGYYAIEGIDPGKYDATVQAGGFKTLTRDEIVFHVGDKLRIDFKMQVGEASQHVEVDGSGQQINTTDASVGTVVDRQFVENMPLNGRSFQPLILLSPGVVTNSPQASAGAPANNNQGQYSVNGTRTDASNFTVDGASASNAPTYNSTAGSAGMMASATALGTTQALLSVDALEEFRIATSTYSAEYGRQPGAQVSLHSRSGSNEYHGTAYDYLRNSVFDANNWFNNHSTIPITRPAERQNDFGGTVGGPLTIPRLYTGRDHAFFFFSYEGLRLTEPEAASITYVPSNGTYNTGTYANPLYKNLRANSPAAVQPLLNAYPLPNCSTAQNPQCVDYGLGGSPFIYSPTAGGIINSINGRLDYQLLPSMRIFARYNDTLATSSTITVPNTSNTSTRNRIFLLGIDNGFGANIANELRLQYSPAAFQSVDVPSQIGGAAPINFYALQGLPAVGGETETVTSLPSSTYFVQQSYGSLQFQPNAIDTITWSRGKHIFKAGSDYRQTTAYYGYGNLSRGPRVVYTFSNANTILNNDPSTTAANFLRTDPTTKNLGLFMQDEWHLHPRLSLSLGLRWDLYPSPSVSGAPTYTYTGNINEPSSLGLSGADAPLYKTTYTNFAPRIGVAVVIHNQPGHELVFRGGGGLFYDGISLNQTFGFGTNLGGARQVTSTRAFPLTSSQILVPVTVVPPYSFQWYPDNRLAPPYNIQWSATLEQAFGDKQTVSLGYVASLGRKLSTLEEYTVSALNPLFSSFDLYENGPGSNYNSLQVKYQRQMAQGLQALASYTWSHAIDWASADSAASAAFPLQRGNADFDVRNNFTAALVYNLPTHYQRKFAKALLGYWNANAYVVARSAFPYEPVGPAIIDPVTGYQITGELNYNGAQPYVSKAGIPGERQINPAIFSVTTNPLGVGSAPRNFLRGFGEAQANLAIQRSFPLYDRAQLLFRAEAFNIANNPTFGSVNTTCGVTAPGAACTNVLMGQATNTLSTALGGTASLYQQGGPRSLQFMLKFLF